jgi:beta-lactamase superfamily II metal-dependent hydrolase
MNSNISRRGFVSLAAAAGVSPWAFAGGSARIRPLAGAPELGGALPGWRKGELDLHFIHTGRGESMFYRFPDGTSMVNDVGDLWRENERHLIPWFPRKDLLAGECVARYVKRELGVAYVDYLAL